MRTDCGGAHGFFKVALGLSLLLLASGCNSRGAVAGKVLYQGKPVPAGTVLFLHESKGSFTSKIQEDGGFQIADVPAGPVKIAVVGPPTSVQGNVQGWNPSNADLEKIKQTQPGVDDAALKRKMGMPAAPPSNKPVLFPEKYTDPEKSGLTYTVVGGSQTHDIVLD